MSSSRDLNNSLINNGSEEPEHNRTIFQELVIDKIIQHQMIISFIPFILITSIRNEIVALWTAFGVSLFNIIVVFYASTYRLDIEKIYWLDASFFVTCLVLAITSIFVYIPTTWLNALTTSTMVAMSLLSMMVGRPWIMQFAKHKASKEVVESKDFKIGMYIMTSYWLLIFAIMCACGWSALIFVESNVKGQAIVLSNKTAYNWLNSYAQYVVLGVGVVFMKTVLIPYFKNRGKEEIKALPSDNYYGENVTIYDSL